MSLAENAQTRRQQPVLDDDRYPSLAGFRAAVSRFPQAVGVLTTVDLDGTPHGVTVGSFIPLSKRPPLLGVALDRRAGMLPILLRTGRFALSLLHDEASEIATVFATRGVDRFATIGWQGPCDSLPVLREHASSVIECDIERTFDGGDHLFVVGAVVDAKAVSEGGPLVYSGRRYFGTHSIAEKGNHS